MANTSPATAGLVGEATSPVVARQIAPCPFPSERSSRTIYLAFDSDVNGDRQHAACRVAQRLWAHGVEAFPVELLQGHDPNSFFAHGTGDAYQFPELLRKASA